jgi:hypothetical protein
VSKASKRLIVKVFWSERNDYQWRLCDSEGAEITQGSAGSFADAQSEGEKQAKRLSK